MMYGSRKDAQQSSSDSGSDLESPATINSPIGLSQQQHGNGFMSNIIQQLQASMQAIQQQSLTEEGWSIDQTEQICETPIDYKSLSSDEIAYFIEYANRAQTVLDTKEGTPLDGDMMAESALRIYQAYGENANLVVPVEDALAQAQIETQYGTQGRENHANNPYNIGEFDGSTEDWSSGMSSTEGGTLAYYDLMANDYLSANDAESLQSNFVNEDGLRYASDPDYESKISSTADYLKDSLGPWNSAPLESSAGGSAQGSGGFLDAAMRMYGAVRFGTGACGE